MRAALRNLVKCIAVIAALVFWFFNPLANDVGTVGFFISIPVLLLCLVAMSVLKDDTKTNDSDP